MIKEIRIKTIEDVLPLLTEQEYRPGLDRFRSSCIYRGMPSADFHMATTLRRNCKQLQNELEPSILKNFAKYAVGEDPLLSESVWRQIILGQHYGLPTRLLDWTRSALVALHFCTAEENADMISQRDGVIWRIDIGELHSTLPEKYRAVLENTKAEVFTVESLSSVADSLESYDRDMGGSSMLVIEPPSFNARIVNQYSFFTVIPLDMDDIESFLDTNTENTVKFIIDKDLRWRIRDMLDDLNMSERSVYPGLEGVSKWIARHYFVKE